MLTILTNGRVLDCISENPLENESVVVENGVIKDIFPGKKPVLAEAIVINLRGKTLLPGLTDAHEHPAGTQVNPEKKRTEPPIYKVLNMRGNLERLLQAGFTTVRDMGGCHWSLKQAVQDGLIKGPRLLIACSYLSPTGGHGDPNLHGEQFFYNDLDRIYKQVRICDGEAECRKATREQIRNGADQIKIFATGGCSSPNDEPWHRQFCEAEIRAIVEEAESVGSYVAAHCLVDTGIRRAVECGVRTIEHGAFLTHKTATLMKERGCFLIPTLSITPWLYTHGKENGVADWMLRKAKEPLGPGKPDCLEAQMDAIQLARKIGIPIGSGTDYISSQMIGGEAMELKLKTEAGMTPYEALKSATIVNAEIMQMKDKIGSIEIGKLADIIAVEGQPDEDINVLLDPANIKLVMKKGVVLKNLL